MSSKACDQYTHCKRNRLYRRLFGAILAFIILILFIILLIFLILRPTKPKFYLRDVSIQEFNTTTTTSPNFISTHLQVTISSRNPNDRIGIYYDKLDTYADYKDQRVTIPTAIPSGYQGHKDVEVWSPFLFGDQIPVGPFLSDSLAQDQSAGFLLLDVKVVGRLRWKVGTWVSGHYHIYVNCPAFFTVADGKGFKLQQMVTCSVDV